MAEEGHDTVPGFIIEEPFSRVTVVEFFCEHASGLVAILQCGGHGLLERLFGPLRPLPSELPNPHLGS
jgi:hypothetical protein